MAFLIGGCAAEVSPLKSVAKATGFATDVGKPSDFVESSRPAGTKFMPVGRPQPARPTAPHSAAEVKAMEKSLDDTRAATAAAGEAARQAGATPAPTAASVPAAAAE